MEIQNKETTKNDFSARLSDEGHQFLTSSEGPSNSCRKVWMRSRPRLLATKSFPPYNQCIGGLGEDMEQDSEPHSESTTNQQPLRNNETMRGDRHTVVQGSTLELTPRCTRDEVKVKWKMRWKERLGGSFEGDSDGWERGRWSGKRRVEETGSGACSHDDRGREGGANNEWKLWGGPNSRFETERNEEDKEKKQSLILAAKGGCDAREETPEANNEVAQKQPGGRKGPTTQQQPSSQPLLSKLLHSSSSNSSCSSINLSSPESDEVFSEGEDASKKRKAFRKVRMQF